MKIRPLHALVATNAAIIVGSVTYTVSYLSNMDSRMEQQRAEYCGEALNEKKKLHMGEDHACNQVLPHQCAKKQIEGTPLSEAESSVCLTILAEKTDQARQRLTAHKCIETEFDNVALPKGISQQHCDSVPAEVMERARQHAALIRPRR